MHSCHTRRMSQSPIEVVVFDAVGTLIYPEPDVAAVYAAVGQRFGSKLDKAEVASRCKRAVRDEDAIACDVDARTSEEIEYERWRRIVGSVLSDSEDASACFLELFAHFARPDSWRVFPEVPDVLASLQSAGT